VELSRSFGTSRWRLGVAAAALATLASALVVHTATSGAQPASTVDSRSASDGASCPEDAGFYEKDGRAFYLHCGPDAIRISIKWSDNRVGDFCIPPDDDGYSNYLLGPADQIEGAKSEPELGRCAQVQQRPPPPARPPLTLPPDTSPPDTSPPDTSPPDTSPPLGVSCEPPVNPPSTKYWVNIFTTAVGRQGPSNACPEAGWSYPRTNPQYVFCRREGGEVRDADGRYNHYWLWTDLDDGADQGWISAYFIDDQGNDQANDMYTGEPIPTC
jgi:hypothetical protein